MKSKKTLILGASDKPSRYAYMAAERLLKHDHPIVMIGARESEIFEHKIYPQKQDFHDIHTITLYLSAKYQKQYYDYILELKPKRVIFNPGTRNPELEKLLDEAGIEWLDACTLVLLSIGEF